MEIGQQLFISVLDPLLNMGKLWQFLGILEIYQTQKIENINELYRDL